MYDYLIVGAGLYGAVFAQQAIRAGKKVLVIDKRNHIAGNAYTEQIEGINCHIYGAHIFHTNNKEVWEYVQEFAKFNNYINLPVANYKGEIYSLPFNMNTFNQMWGVTTPQEVTQIIEEQSREISSQPANLEEQAISLVGRDIYEKLIKGYTEKQWGRSCKDLPPSIIKRIPVRMTYDSNYYDALYQGIPVDGYTRMIENMLQGAEIRLEFDYLKNRSELDKLADKIVYSGPIDAYFDYKLGHLQYRSVRFENTILNTANYQGRAVVNYTDSDSEWTRIIEHKWFNFGLDADGNDISKTVITKEYSMEWKLGVEPFYPINDSYNDNLYSKYLKLTEGEKDVIFGGRLGEYKYYDMDQVIESALKRARKELEI